jgi:hypothetical protein
LIFSEAVKIASAGNKKRAAGLAGGAFKET